eukprot:CAMPEP_0117759562 /NCGR_PEP_ID=MMETSP0947-20121206/16089_1 /TAXON_ID=44440 /ORGANISM="Chattonella subsalsa, Strain CCMP2191" /LENGTH=86 /DNA_ID=CAMNT_0005580047 /DNA_START=185 /DNA_END=442 /DNA_ORIENTATION=+
MNLEEEIKLLRAELPPQNIQTINPEFIQFTIARTAYTKVGCRIMFPENYPLEPLLLELNSQVLGPKLVKKAEKIGRDEASRLAKEG